MKNFKNKIVVVTGAGSGMGRAYALEFARLGAILALNDFDKAGLDETIRLVAKKHPKIKVLGKAFDVSQREQMNDFADQVKLSFGNAHVIINNAGVSGGAKPVWELADQEIDRVMGINLFGVIYGTRAFLPQLFANKEGAVINVSSIFGLIGTPFNADYCATKFAVRGFTEALMVELHDTPIGVHLVHPGGIKTNIAKSSNSEFGADFEERYLKTSADDIVKYVIKKVKQGEPRIVYGYQARRVQWASLALNLKSRNAFIYKEMKEFIEQYKPF